MKLTLLFLCIFFAGISHSQISVSQLIRIDKMDMESFEIYAIEQGYTFNKVIDSELEEGLLFLKYDKYTGITRYLSKFSKWYSAKSHSSYNAHDNNSELSSIYRSLKELGFKLSETEYNKHGADLIKTYVKGEAEIRVFVTKENFQIGCTFGWGT